MKERKRFGMYLRTDLMEKFKELADEEDISVSRYFEKLVKKELEEQEDNQWK